MQVEDDDFPYTSDDPSLAPPDDKNSLLSLTPQQVGDLKATLRLAVGSAMSGTDAFTKRLRNAQSSLESAKPETIVVDEHETAHDQLRYFLLGILFETPDLLQRSLSTIEQVTTNVYHLFAKILSPVTSSWVFSPVRGQYDSATARGEQIIDRLIMKGRMEEQNSRQMLQQKNIDDLVNEFLEYIILKTEVQELIQEGGIGVASNVVDEFREQSSHVDSIIDQKFKSLFHKRVPPQTETLPGNPADEG
jgi:hypothetical protein